MINFSRCPVINTVNNVDDQAGHKVDGYNNASFNVS